MPGPVATANPATAGAEGQGSRRHGLKAMHRWAAARWLTVVVTAFVLLLSTMDGWVASLRKGNDGRLFL